MRKHTNATRKLHILQTAVESYYRLPQDTIMQRVRTTTIKDSRQVFVYLACRYDIASLTAIGQYFEGAGRKRGYDHSTIIHSRQRVQDLLRHDDELKADIEEIRKEYEERLSIIELNKGSVDTEPEIIAALKRNNDKIEELVKENVLLYKKIYTAL